MADPGGLFSSHSFIAVSYSSILTNIVLNVVLYFLFFSLKPLPFLLPAHSGHDVARSAEAGHSALRGELVGARLQRDDALALQLLVLRNLLASLTNDLFLQKCLGNLEKKVSGHTLVCGSTSRTFMNPPLPFWLANLFCPEYHGVNSLLKRCASSL